MYNIDHHYETINGYKISDLIHIAVILEAEGLTPEDVRIALTDFDLLLDAFTKYCNNILEKEIERL